VPATPHQIGAMLLESNDSVTTHWNSEALTPWRSQSRPRVAHRSGAEHAAPAIGQGDVSSHPAKAIFEYPARYTSRRSLGLDKFGLGAPRGHD
jgi:hypothetical protein